MKYEVFISYRRKNSGDFPLQLYTALTNMGVSAFYDKKELKFIDFRKQLISNNLQSNFLILLLSPDALNPQRCNMKNDWVRREIELFLKLKKKIIFVKYPGFEFPNEKELPKSLRKIKKLVMNNKNVVEYNGDAQQTIQKIINKIAGPISSEVTDRLKNIKNHDKFATSLSEKHVYAKKEYRKYSIKNFFSEVINLTLLLLSTFGIYKLGELLGSFVLYRIIMLIVISFFIYCKKNEVVSTFLNDGLSDGFVEFLSAIGHLIKGIVIFVVAVFAVVILSDYLPIINEIINSQVTFIILSFSTGAIVTITTLVFVYEAIISIFHIINSHIVFSFTKTLIRQTRIEEIPDKIILDSASTRNAIIIQIVFAIITIAKDLYFDFPNYLI